CWPQQSCSRIQAGAAERTRVKRFCLSKPFVTSPSANKQAVSHSLKIGAVLKTAPIRGAEIKVGSGAVLPHHSRLIFRAFRVLYSAVTADPVSTAAKSSDVSGPTTSPSGAVGSKP